MNELFLSILLFVCNDFTGIERAICTRDMLECRYKVMRDYSEYERPDQLIEQCLDNVYLDYFKDIKK